VLLPDAIDTADPLLDLHRVPREVVVHDHVAELEVQTFAACIGGDHDLCVGRKAALCLPPFL
jgi:hypothetical protein